MRLRGSLATEKDHLKGGRGIVNYFCVAVEGKEDRGSRQDLKARYAAPDNKGGKRIG